MTSLAALAAACLVAAVAAILGNAPGWSDPDWSYLHPPPPKGGEAASGTRWVTFSGGRDGTTVLAGRLSLPAAAEAGAGNDNNSSSSSMDPAPPVVVLAHGLGLSHDCSLRPYVDAFTSEGYAAFTFDYATFGASGGGGTTTTMMPRHSVDPETHITDLRAAVAAVRSSSDALGVDADRIALWGTSLGGGHVLAAVADASAAASGGEREKEGLPGVRAVVAQVPHLASGLEGVIGTVSSDVMVYLPGLAKIMAGMVKAALLGLAGWGPWYFPLHGPPGSAAAMQNPGDDAGYGSLCPPGGGSFGWRNGLTAGSVPRILLYRPLNRVSAIQETPVLMVAAEEDTLCPARWAAKAASLIPNAEVAVLPDIGHFDVYGGKPLEEMLKLQINFLGRHLPPQR